MSIGERILTLFVLIAVPLTFLGVPIFVFTGGLQKFTLKPLQKRFAGLNLHESLQPGDVKLGYHTYRGFLIWFVQDEHRIYAPPADARLLLTRLLRFNLTWGMLSYGLLFVPLLAIGNYLAQKRALENQENEASPTASPQQLESQ